MNCHFPQVNARRTQLDVLDIFRDFFLMFVSIGVISDRLLSNRGKSSRLTRLSKHEQMISVTGLHGSVLEEVLFILITLYSQT